MSYHGIRRVCCIIWIWVSLYAQKDAQHTWADLRVNTGFLRLVAYQEVGSVTFTVPETTRNNAEYFQDFATRELRDKNYMNEAARCLSFLVTTHPQPIPKMASAEIHDLYDSILILDFGSQVSLWWLGVRMGGMRRGTVLSMLGTGLLLEIGEEQ